MRWWRTPFYPDECGSRHAHILQAALLQVPCWAVAEQGGEYAYTSALPVHGKVQRIRRTYHFVSICLPLKP